MKLLLLLAFVPFVLPAQTRKQRKAMELQQKADQQVLANLNNHVQFFTANTEDAAKEYISKQFALAGLQPKGSDGYFQSFNVHDGRQIGSETFLKVNDQTLMLNKDYTPLCYSASKPVSGMPAMALREKGVPWFADVKDLTEQTTANQPGSLEKEVQKEATRAASKGATALFIYNSANLAENLRFNGKDTTAAAPIPVVYILGDGYKKYFSDNADILDIDMNISIKEKNIAGSNVAGFIDNGAASTVVIGANYGGVLSSANTESPVGETTKKSLEKNVSGAATLIELAKMLSVSKSKNNNYLLIAFNQEEQELAGSRYWVEHAATPFDVSYVITINPVDKTYPDKKLWVGGLKTSKTWEEVVPAIADKNADIGFDTTTENSKPLSAYMQKDIPVLFLAKGDIEQADRQPDLKMAKMVYNIIEAVNNKTRLAFTKQTPVEMVVAQANHGSAEPAVAQTTLVQVSTKEPAKYPAKTSVSLGVIPDNNPAEGLRINGVSPRKLASKIGLQPGDILTYLGTYKIGDMKTYIQALSNFKPGDKTVLGIKRGKEDKEFAVEF